MIKQSKLMVEPTEVIPTDGEPLKNISPGHKRRFRNAQDGHERRVADHIARLTQANEQLRYEIQERRFVGELLRMQQRYLGHFVSVAGSRSTTAAMP